MGILRVIDKSGDSEQVWHLGDNVETKAAMDRFNQLIKQGHIAYRQEDNGGATQIKNFDKEAREILLAPQLQGG